MGGAMVGYLSSIPVVYPITICVVSTLILAFGIVRAIIKYKKWLRLKDIREHHFGIAGCLQRIHDHVASVSMSQAEALTESEYEVLKSLLPEFKNQLSRQQWKMLIVKKPKMKDMRQLTTLLAAMMDTQDVGMSRFLKCDAEYIQMTTCLDGMR